MYRQVMAFDFDGTLAENGKIPLELESALARCRASGHALFLVTGRRFESVSLGPAASCFTGVVWENGAVLSHTASGEVYVPFGQLSARVLSALKEAEIPFDQGLAIAATWEQHAQRVWKVLGTHGGEASVEYNKGNIMIVPPGATKAAGLERLLAICGFSIRNLAAFGDAENDLSMLTLAEVAVAVGDALPAVQEAADVVAKQPGPAGVLEVLQAYPLAGRFLDIPLKRERPVLIGYEETGHSVTIPASRLAGRNLGVFGDSGTGKSWMVGLLAEGLHHEEYQVLIIDPEGDFRGMRVLPRFLAFDGNQHSMPAPSAIASLLDSAGMSVVLDLSQFPVGLRSGYVSELIRIIRPLRERKYRPHWIVMDEAQQFLFQGSEVVNVVAPLLGAGGWAFISYRPDRLSSTIVRELHHCLLTRLSDPDAAHALSTRYGKAGVSASVMQKIPAGSVLLCGGPVVRLRPAIRRVPHIRHLYKYMDVPLPPWKRFWFRDAAGGIGLEAASLYEFLHLIPTLPIGTLEYHNGRQDFAQWAEKTLGDAELAARLRKISNRQLKGEELREALRQTVAAHYAELTAMR